MTIERSKVNVYPKIARRGYVRPSLGNEHFGRQRTILPGRVRRTQGSNLAERYVSGHSTNPAGRPHYTIASVSHVARAPSHHVAGVTSHLFRVKRTRR